MTVGKGVTRFRPWPAAVCHWDRVTRMSAGSICMPGSSRGRGSAIGWHASAGTRCGRAFAGPAPRDRSSLADQVWKDGRAQLDSSLASAYTGQGWPSATGTLIGGRPREPCGAGNRNRSAGAAREGRRHAAGVRAPRTGRCSACRQTAAAKAEAETHGLLCCHGERHPW